MLFGENRYFYFSRKISYLPKIALLKKKKKKERKEGERENERKK